MIAQELHRSPVTIYAALRAAGETFEWRKLPPDAVIRREVLAGLSQHAIARKYGTTRGAVSHRVAFLGLHGKSRVPRTVRKAPDDDAIRADVSAGMSRNALTRKYAITRSTLAKHLNRLGLHTTGNRRSA